MTRSDPALRTAALVATLACLVTGCSGDARSTTTPGRDETPIRPAQTLALPEDATRSLPQGHPPLDGANRAAAAPDVQWDVPPSWIEVQPASSMRVAQYRIDGAGGDAECVVFYFGPSQGGNALANAQRWAGQFEQPDGSSSLDRMKVVDIEGASAAAQLVEITGTYDGGMTMTDKPATPRPGFMLLGGIVQGPDAPWFFKLTGPEATVRAERDHLLSVLRSFRAKP